VHQRTNKTQLLINKASEKKIVLNSIRVEITESDTGGLTFTVTYSGGHMCT